MKRFLRILVVFLLGGHCYGAEPPEIISHLTNLNFTAKKPVVCEGSKQWSIAAGSFVRISDIDWTPGTAIVKIRCVDSCNLWNEAEKRTLTDRRNEVGLLIVEFKTPAEFLVVLSESVGLPRYELELKGGGLVHEDKIVSVIFQPNPQAIQLKIKNNTSAPIKIDWGSSSFINPEGEAEGIVHQGVKLINKDEHQEPTTIPPGASITDLVVPRNRIEWNDSTNSWDKKPLLDYQPNNSLEGKQVSFIPVLTETKTHNLNIVFNVHLKDGLLTP